MSEEQKQGLKWFIVSIFYCRRSRQYQIGFGLHPDGRAISSPAAISSTKYYELRKLLKIRKSGPSKELLKLSFPMTKIKPGPDFDQFLNSK